MFLFCCVVSYVYSNVLHCIEMAIHIIQCLFVLNKSIFRPPLQIILFPVTIQTGCLGSEKVFFLYFLSEMPLFLFFSGFPTL